MDRPPPPAPQSPAKRFPGRASAWQLARRRLELPRRPLVMGILNVTPDSFSDGGTHDAVDASRRSLVPFAERRDLTPVARPAR